MHGLRSSLTASYVLWGSTVELLHKGTTAIGKLRDGLKQLRAFRGHARALRFEQASILRRRTSSHQNGGEPIAMKLLLSGL